MEKYKVERISGLNNEVRELHPLLAALFPRLPNITQSDYRQGPNEKGTDFVLTKRDATLDTETYIGVVVKSGGIRQAMDDVNRQIDECEMERWLESGKKKVFVNEVWVVTNESISHNAQEKIHHKYKNKSIQFIDIQKLIALIDRHYPAYWKVESVEVSEYFAKTKLILTEISSACNVSMQDAQSIYIPPNLRLIEPDSRKQKGSSSWKAKFFSPEKVMMSHDRLILIEGEMGMGKTRLIIKLAEDLCDPEVFRDRKILPLVVQFISLCKDYDTNLGQYVTNKMKECGLEDSGIKFVVFVDGVDERKCTNNERIELLRSCVSSANHDLIERVIFSSRTSDDAEYESKLGKIITRYRIAPLSSKQLIAYVEKLCPIAGAREKLQRELGRSNLLKVLPRTPISAILLGRLLREQYSEIPSTLTELYSKYTELVLGRWDMSKGLQSQTEYDVITNLVSKVSKFMLDNSLHKLPLGDARQMLREYVSSRNLKVDLEESFVKFCDKKEIFFIDEQRGTLSFRHRTFAEFFYARQFDENNPAEISEIVYDLYWENVYFFLFGLKRDSASLVSSLTKIPVSTEHLRLVRALHNPKLLLAAYLTPYSEIDTVVKFGFKEIASIFADSTSGNARGALSQLPPMAALFILTYGVMQAYGYEFFKKSLDEYWLELATINNPSELQYIEMFLICAARMPLESRNTFEELVNTHEKQLPLVIKLGIFHCSEDSCKDSSILKRYSKKLQKTLKSSNNRDALSALYKKPSKERDATNIGSLPAKKSLSNRRCG